MKTNRKNRITLLAGLLIFSLAGCRDLTGSSAGTPEETIPPGKGLARIRLRAGDGSPLASVRTALPEIGSLYFTLEFTALEKTTVHETLDSGLSLTVALEPAVWTLTVRGYPDALHTDPEDLKVTGTTSVAITGGTAASFEVYLTPNLVSGGSGSLSYSVSFPAGVNRALLGLYPMDDTPGTSHEIDLSSSPNGTIPNIPEGVYRVVIDLYDSVNNRAAGHTEAVHIYDLLPTPLTRNFTTANFADCPPVVGESASTLADKLDAALASPAGAYTIVLDGTESDLGSFTSKTLNVTGNKNISIIIRGNAATVRANSFIPSPLFTLEAVSGSSLSLELRDLTLRGLAANSVPVVQVNSRGTLLMKAGSLITGNYSSPAVSSGGGVYVSSGGTFTMSGGAVSGNSFYYGGGVYVVSGTFTMSGGAVSNNSASYGSGVYVNSGGTFTMSGGAVSNNSSPYGGGCGVYVNSGTFTMSGGAVSGNSASNSSYGDGGGVYVSGGTFTMLDGAVSGNSAPSGGGVYVNSGTFTMSGGAVSGNSASTYGGGVYVRGGTFTMSGGAVNSNTLSGTGSYGREVLVSSTGAFKMSGDARPERVFLNGVSRYIAISGLLNGPVTPIDLGVTSAAPLTTYGSAPILRLDSTYLSGDMASLKNYFSLGNSQLTESPYTEEAITGYKISDTGLFAAE
jgi:hypothetical protein